MIDKKKLALVHSIKKELNLSDPEYRKILKEAAGVKSAKELDEVSFRQLMSYFVRSKYYQVNRYGLTMRQKMFIQFLVRQLGWDDNHLKNFLHKYYNKYEIAKLTKKEGRKVIEALKSISEHQKGVLV